MLFLGSVTHSLPHSADLFSFFIKLNKNAFTTEVETVCTARLESKTMHGMFCGDWSLIARLLNTRKENGIGPNAAFFIQ